MGTNLGRYPRHSITYANLFTCAVDALKQFCLDVQSGAYPQADLVEPKNKNRRLKQKAVPSRLSEAMFGAVKC